MPRDTTSALEFSYRGTTEQADVSYAFGYLGDLMIQFIEQHDETPSIYTEMFRRGQEGFHHTAYLVHDFAAERSRMIDLGYPLACELWADDVNAAYFDTRALNGGFTEIHGDPGHILSVFALGAARTSCARRRHRPSSSSRPCPCTRAPLLPLQ